MPPIFKPVKGLQTNPQSLGFPMYPWVNDVGMG